MQKLTVVMYHYVRPLKNTRYPNIKGLDTNLFKEQLHYLQKHYNFVSMEQVIDAKDSNTELPPHSVLLTFDDAYVDHFLYVYPTLKKMKIQGSFFAPVRAIQEPYILDVNKIHFILASTEDRLDLVIQDIRYNIEMYKKEYQLRSFEEYYQNLAVPNRFDNKDVIFVKRLLQAELPEELRNKITSSLFLKYVGVSDECFRNELYMSQEHCQHMVEDGMHFGSHGFNHYWWDRLDKTQLTNEIVLSKQFLTQIGMDPKYLSVCYPYGAYNLQTLNILREFDFKIGFTTKVNLADLKNSDLLEIPRLDTNDLPKDANANTNKWYTTPVLN